MWKYEILFMHTILGNACPHKGAHYIISPDACVNGLWLNNKCSIIFEICKGCVEVDIGGTDFRKLLSASIQNWLDKTCQPNWCQAWPLGSVMSIDKPRVKKNITCFHFSPPIITKPYSNDDGGNSSSPEWFLWPAPGGNLPITGDNLVITNDEIATAGPSDLAIANLGHSFEEGNKFFSGGHSFFTSNIDGWSCINNQFGASKSCCANSFTNVDSSACGWFGASAYLKDVE